MQRLLRTACWDADAVRDDVRGYVIEQLGPDGVLIRPGCSGDLNLDTNGDTTWPLTCRSQVASLSIQKASTDCVHRGGGCAWAIIHHSSVLEPSRSRVRVMAP